MQTEYTLYQCIPSVTALRGRLIWLSRFHSLCIFLSVYELDRSRVVDVVLIVIVALVVVAALIHLHSLFMCLSLSLSGGVCVCVCEGRINDTKYI